MSVQEDHLLPLIHALRSVAMARKLEQKNEMILTQMTQMDDHQHELLN